MTTNTDPDSIGIFSSRDALQAAFEERLHRMLGIDELGVFILVLANASFEPAMFERMRDALAGAFAVWRQRSSQNDTVFQQAAPDDRAVFERLCLYGFDNLTATRWKRLGPWQLQFNPIRAFRPSRMSGTRVETLYKSFDPAGFHFNKPFLRKEILWEGELAGEPLRLLYNKFPFAPLHGLLVPHPSADHPQYLTESLHGAIWRVAQRIGAGVPDVGFAYNAYGAFSSVNHLHFQMFVAECGGLYPIESAHWRHNGGPHPYPLVVDVFDDERSSWEALQALHACDCAYNLLYRPGRLYVVERAMQGSHVQSEWTGGFAWSEVAGAVTVFNEDDFARLTADDIDAELRALAVTP